MSEWFRTSISNGLEPSPGLLGWRIGSALLLGFAVAGIYRWARRGESVQPTFLTTLVMLSILIAVVTQVIGDNVARAFSLVGALSVVRFRTVVKDTQDTAFVIFAVVIGMAAGANNLTVAVVGLAVVAAAGVFLWMGRSHNPWTESSNALTIRTDLARSIQPEIEKVLFDQASRFQLASVETSLQGSSLELGYVVRLRPGASPAEVVGRLSALAGVQSVGLKGGR